VSAVRALLGRWGVVIGREPGTSRLRLWSLAAASAILALALVSLVLTLVTLQGRSARAKAADPLTTAISPNPPRLLWMPLHFDTLGDTQVTVIGLEPTAADAPLPPGVDRWPGPGQAVLSPALIRDMPKSWTSRYGTVIGVIREPGLTSPTVYLAYVRPSTSQLAELRGSPAGNDLLLPTSGFGDQGLSGYPQSAWLQAPQPAQVVVGVLVGILAPALMGLGVLTGVGTEQRRAHWHTLRRVGVRRREYAWMEFSRSWRPVLAGTVVGALVYAALTLRNTRIPGLTYVLDVQDCRRALPWVVLALGCAAVAALVLASLPPRLAGAGVSSARGSVVERSPWVRSGLLAVAFVAMAIVPKQIPRSAQWGRVLVYEACFIAVVFLLPSIVTLVVSAAGRAISATGRRLGAASMMVAGGQLASGRSRAQQFAVTITAGMLIVGQAAGWSGVLGEQYVPAQEAQARLGTHVLLARSVSPSPGLDRFLGDLPAGTLLLSLRRGGDNPNVTLVSGSCPTLARLGITPCPASPTSLPLGGAPELTDIQRWTTPLRVVGGFVVEDGDGLALIGADRTQLDLTAMQNAGYAAVAGGLGFDALGHNWIVAAAGPKSSSRAVTWLGALAFMILVLALAARLAADVVSSAVALGPLAVLAGTSRVFRAIAAWRLLATCLTAVAMGGGGYLLAAMALGRILPVLGPSGRFLGTAALFASVFCVLAAALAGSAAWRLAQTWRPGAGLRAG
jgi:hypothetical protein